MRVFAGIDEAGYGPKFGPLTAGRCVLAIESDGDGLDDAAESPDFWELLGEAVCQKPRDSAKRIAVADSKKLTVSGKHGHAGVPHLERGVLAFGSLHLEALALPATVDVLLASLGSRHHERDDLSAWYVGENGSAWDALPVATPAVAGRNGHDAESLALDAGLLRRAARQAGIGAAEALPCLGVAVLCEDVYNQRLAHASSKAEVSFALIAHHLQYIWQRHGTSEPVVVVDRQGGRTRYSGPLARAIAGASVRVIEEHAGASAYALDERSTGRRMTVRFMPKADELHLPVALASMTAKYARELYMHRFQRWFATQLPEIKSTAGYGTDANRFAGEVAGHLAGLGIEKARLIRRA